jgi:hypothetical protein
MERVRDRERTMLVVAGAIGLGVHAGLAPEHLEEWAPLGACFVASAVALAGGVAALAVGREYCGPAAAAMALVFAALVVGYIATRLAALPPLDPEREPFDSLGVVTTAIEAAGLVAAVRLATRETSSSIPGGKQ